MRLVSTVFRVAVMAGVCQGFAARADQVVFNTLSTATQNIDSVLGDFSLTSTGTQQFTIDTTSGAANVTSLFKGNDFPDPYSGGSDGYNLYNTVTTGVATIDGDGSYDITYHLLFELDVTSGDLNGLSLVTELNATFATTGASLPFAPGRRFPTRAGRTRSRST